MALNKNYIFKAIVAAASGAIMTLALPPYDIWPFIFAGFSVFYTLLAGIQTKRAAFFLGWCFGFGYFTCGLWWIANAMLVPGNPFNWVWPLAICGLPALMAVFTALAAMITRKFVDLKNFSGLFLFVALFGAFEWVRGHLFTGFPWNLYGYVWSGTPEMLQLAAIIGSYGLTILTIFWAVIPGFFAVGKTSRTAMIALGLGATALAILSLSHGHQRLGENPTKFMTDTGVRVVQPNIPQEEKWDPQNAGVNLLKLLSYSGVNPHEPDTALTFIIWPETAITWQAIDHAGASKSIRDTLAQHPKEVFLMTGYLRHDDKDDAYYNSLAVFDRNLNIVSMFDKFHLVPFGEYIPFQKLFSFIEPLATFESFRTGPGPQTLSAGAGPSFSPLVCYEVIFPGHITAQKGQRASWIVNVTNDAWYGDSPGPRQHFAQARIRAIEEGLPLVRAANTGISGIIDPLGRVIDMIPLDRADSRTSLIPQALPAAPPYARWRDYPFFASLALLAALSALLKGKSK